MQPGCTASRAGETVRRLGPVDHTASRRVRPFGAGAGDEAGPTNGDAPRIFLYDAYPGGIGFSAPLFAMHGELLSRTRALIEGCGCDQGCPTCVGPVGETGPLAKRVALRLLQHLAPAPVHELAPQSALPAADDVPF